MRNAEERSRTKVSSGYASVAKGMGSLPPSPPFHRVAAADLGDGLAVPTVRITAHDV